ncbi:MAG: 30S ribosomal protein S17 [Patescibacteria group bacterium]|uniref:30S ribosomal protein S17 n=1 Tax=candidate division WWE3 bacterium TaxID=2053526 RepID=A0A955EBD5_UNCKA|nr:30S ribosomal protein S17 [candidate division WWE3 bacterium]
MPKRILTGQIVSTKMNNAVIVLVSTDKSHPRYGKRITTTKRYPAKVTSSYEVGDMVRIQECPPVSKTIRWEVLDKVTGGAN